MARRGREQLRGRWVREAKGVVALALAGFGFLALLSYDPTRHWLDQSAQMGPVGLWLGWGLFWLFGYAGYLFPLVLGAYGIAAFVRTSLRPGIPPLVGLALLLVAATGLLARTPAPTRGGTLPRGGVVGAWVADLLHQGLGSLGSLLVVLALLPLAFLCLTRLSYAVLSRALIGRLRRRARRPAGREVPTIAEPAPAAEPSPAPIIEEAPPVVERRRPKAPLLERGLAWQETFDFTKAGGEFQLPPLALLKTPPKAETRRTREELQANADLLRRRLEEFGVGGRIVQINPGPVITSYEFEPAPGVKVNQVVNLADDLALAMKAAAVRVVGPVPGRGTVAIEVPNPEPSIVYLREVLMAREYAESRAALPLALGKDSVGQPYVADLSAMPHLLIAGATGSGKSACLNAMICSILYRQPPTGVRFLMIDPKRLELGIYEGIPHLMAPVVTDAKEAAARLRWIVGKMDERYRLLASKSVRNIEGYNREAGVEARLPYWVVVVDELADLMMVSAGEVENSLARLAQIARAVGIHLLIATQRPSVDVITGLIKANFAARVAFQVASKVDSRTILDQNGAEQLLGRGDMLFLPPGASRPIRVHGSWVSEAETREVVSFLRRQGEAVYEEALVAPATQAAGGEAEEAERDDLYWKAVELVISQKQASISFLQRRLGLGYPKAARFIDLMEQDRIIGPGDGAKPRQILVGFDYLHRRVPGR